MRHTTKWAFALVALGLTQPAAAQLEGLPVYFNPRGGTGLRVAGEYGRGINDDSGEESMFAARATAGFAALTLGVGVGTYDTGSETEIQYMGTAAIRLIGGPFVPVSVSVQAGVGRLSVGDGSAAITRYSVPLGVGVGLNIPGSAFSFEPWLAPRYALNRIETSGESINQTGFGLSAGVSLGFANGLEVHGAVDWVDLNISDLNATLFSLSPDVQPTTIGLGISYAFRLPG